MELLREPFVWYVTTALISLGVTFVLFKYLKSSALMTNKNYLLTGGIAGFLFIFLVSWYTFTPVPKAPVTPLQPSNIPEGFEVISEPDLAIAFPRNYGPARKSKEIKLYDNKEEKDLGEFTIIIEENVPSTTFTNFNLETPPEEFSKAFPMLKWEKAQPAPYQGRKGYIMPMTITLPKEIEPDENKRTKRAFAHYILDERARRLIRILYEDNELGKQIFSTLNLGP